MKNMTDSAYNKFEERINKAGRFEDHILSQKVAGSLKLEEQ